MLQQNVIEMEESDLLRDVNSLKEWLAHWGDNEALIPMAKTSLRGLLDAFDRMKAERDAYQRRSRRMRQCPTCHFQF